MVKWLAERNRELIPETMGSIIERNDLLFVEKMMWMDERQ